MSSWANNLLLLTDSYKVSHAKQYPPGVTRMKAYFESRGGEFHSTIFFGLQYILKKWLTIPVTMEMVDEAESHYNRHFAGQDIFFKEGWISIVKNLNGKLPLKIRAVAEGTLVPVKNVLFTVETTEDGYGWLASFVETILVQIWYPLTVCTNSFFMKKMLFESMQKSCDNLDGLKFKLHDFGFRGVSCVEQAGIGGCAHLANFEGTDNNAAIVFSQHFYNVGRKEDWMPALSVPASEHSVMTSWGPKREKEAALHILNQFPNTPVSLVCDSYNLQNFIKEVIGDPEVKEAIIQRSHPLIVRPDSGDPAEILIEVLSLLYEIFPGKPNSKGFKLLPSYIRVIQGDGISKSSLAEILKKLETNNWSLDNVVFGSGGSLLQKFDRDTQKCAYKTCWAIIDGKEVDVFKNPSTDAGKMSKPGNLTLVKTHAQEIVTKRMENLDPDDEDLLKDVYLNGIITQTYSLEDIRERINGYFK